MDNLLLRFLSLSLMALRSALMLQKQWHLHSHCKILLHHELKLLHSWKGDPNISLVQVGEQEVSSVQSTPERETVLQREFLHFSVLPEVVDH